MIRGIAVHAKQGGGKTTTCQIIEDHLKLLDLASQRLSFAEPLKAATRDVLTSLGIPCEDADWKYRHRTQLQVLGTSLRDFHVDVWVDLLVKRAYQQPPGTIILVDDLRYWNEAHALREAGFFLVHLEVSREVREARGIALAGETHASETDLDDHGEIFHVSITVDQQMTAEAIASTIVDAFSAFQEAEGV